MSISSGQIPWPEDAYRTISCPPPEQDYDFQNQDWLPEPDWTEEDEQLFNARR